MKEVVLVYRLSQLYDTSYTTYCDGSPVSANISRTLQGAFMVSSYLVVQRHGFDSFVDF